MANTFCRGTIKTYSRQKAHLENSYDVDRPRKRICMDNVGNAVARDISTGRLLHSYGPAKQASSTIILEGSVSSSVSPPSSPALRDQPFLPSDPAQEEESPLSSPPSSPPERLPSPVTTSRRPAFSFLKRIKPSDVDPLSPHPLSEVTANVRKLQPVRNSKTTMTQTQIDLGGDVRKSCRMCGMEYVPSVKEDAELHKVFCGMNLDGIDLGKSFLKDETLRRGLSVSATEQKEEVIAVDRRCSLGVKNQVKRILESVNTELSAANIHDDTLWEPSRVDASEKQTAGKRKANQHHQETNGNRFKAFMYLVGDRCVGFCLAERISNAYSVTCKGPIGRQAHATVTSSSLSVSHEANLALLGISRIWTSRSFRDKGIATKLLDSARLNFYYGVQVPKHLVAFSQPTESGGRLAEKWFGAKDGWGIYQVD